MMEYLKIGAEEVPYQIVTSQRAKRINIAITNGLVKVTIPQGGNLEQAKRFVQAKQHWIQKHLHNQHSSAQSQPLRHTFEAGELFLYLGASYPLRLIFTPNQAVQVEHNPEGFWLYLPSSLPLEERPAKVKAVLQDWYRAQARRLFETKLALYAPQLGVTFQTLRIKEQKTKWGSCSQRANINLNWKLIMAPEVVLDYVVIHELAHLRQMNHSPSFWQLVASCQPAYLTSRKWLKEHGKDLVF